MLRNRMLADPSFLFKVGTEVGLYRTCFDFEFSRKKDYTFPFCNFVLSVL